MWQNHHHETELDGKRANVLQTIAQKMKCVLMAALG
jgi:hypothetical protein